ncbi:Amino acid ABC transporter permease (plasmid) [Rhodovastum atsumiense]|uniref:ABC transporter permease subunit n=1 Tax=Rhodovastum atsumiense TaxID=504468 RepID=UPI002024A9FD|nr:ABC transporter permease subunit [Rhodovastum atsumiense]CAH2605488.1 Amino acid ABC transporter permease [Rhodovastum atsumiense]
MTEAESRRDAWLGTGVALLILVLLWLALTSALARRGLSLDFSALGGRAGFAVAEGVLEVSPDAAAWWAILAGLLNTVRVAGCAVLLALALAVPLAIARHSPWQMARTLATWIIEPLRNTPLPLQLFLWYGLLLNLPGPRAAWHLLPGVLLSNRGLALPSFVNGTLSVPALQGFNIEGGVSLSPEFCALAFGLGVFHAAYLAEVLRAGLAAVPAGQTEAATALGLPNRLALRLVILPQALGFALAPGIWQVLQLVKNASLGLLIGYQDLVGVTNIAVNQTGRGLEGLILVVLTYLALNGVLVLALRALERPSSRTALQPAAPHKWTGRHGRAGHWGNVALGGALALAIGYWGIDQAAFTGGPRACAAANGACWAVVEEKWRLILFGSYPLAEQWRPALATALLALGLLGTGRVAGRHPVRAALGCLVLLALWGWLMGGGGGLAPVPSADWGGLPLTLGLAALALILGAFIALPLALGGQSRHLALRVTTGMIIALFRSVPVVVLLLAASVLLPLLLAPDWSGSKLARALAALIGVTAAQLAVVLRSALRALPAGQVEAARSLGLSAPATLMLVQLPQALRIGLPAAVNVFVSTVKDTSLVLVVGLLDLTATTQLAVQEPQWRTAAPDAYLLLAATYFLICYPLGRYADALRARREATSQG